MLNLFKREAREKNFWDWFVKNSDRYEALFVNTKDTNTLVEQLHTELQKVNPGLVCEIIKGDSGDINELAISADGIKKNFPAVLRLIEQAPHLPNWRFTAFRPRKGGNTIKSENVEVRPAEVFFKHNWQRELINLHLFVKNYVDSDAYHRAVFLLLDDVLGEYDVATKVGTIDISKLENPEGITPLKELPRIVDEKIGR